MMTDARFSVITDLYSPTQLRKGLAEAGELAQALAGYALEGQKPPDSILSSLSYLQWAASDIRMMERDEKK